MTFRRLEESAVSTKCRPFMFFSEERDSAGCGVTAKSLMRVQVAKKRDHILSQSAVRFLALVAAIQIVYHTPSRIAMCCGVEGSCQVRLIAFQTLVADSDVRSYSLVLQGKTMDQLQAGFHDTDKSMLKVLICLTEVIAFPRRRSGGLRLHDVYPAPTAHGNNAK